MKNNILPIILILIILLIPDKVSETRTFAFDERMNEGTVAFVVTAYEPTVKEEEKEKEEESKDCKCNGTGYIKSPEGFKIGCPCGDNCKCKKKAGNSGLEVGATRSQEVPYEEYYVVKFEATWCGPCKQWDKTEKGKLKAIGLEVVSIDIDKNPPDSKFGITSFPAFLLCKKDGKVAYPDRLKEIEKKLKTTNLSAEILIEEVNKLHKALNPQKVSGVSSFYSQEELDSLVRSSYNKNTPLKKMTMAKGADVYSHLYNDHGFKKEQVDGLEYWVALALHDAVHEPSTITPRRN